MRGASIVTLSAVALLHLAILGLIALRWQVVMRYFGEAPHYPTTAGLTVVGTFFNLVLPFNVAGDALRVALGARNGIAHGVGLGSVVIDRALGIAGLGCLVLIGFSLGSARGLSPAVPAVVLAVALTPIAAFAVLVYLSRRISGGRLTAPNWAAGIAQAMAARGRRHVLLLFGLGLAGVCHILSALAMTLLANDLGHRIEFSQGLLLFPGVLLAGMLPISVGGWGLREIAAIEILSSAGIPAAAAVSISLLFIGILLIESLFGMAAWFLLHRRRPAIGRG